MLKITNYVPNTWVDLQNNVAKYFMEAGYSATTPCKLKGVRGEVEVDVFVSAPDELAKKIICECKFWSTPVPQEKVHAFRTVVGDTGATLGILISKSGFQAGAVKAAEHSNVLLLTWNNFLDLIYERWLTRQTKRLKLKNRSLYVYSSPLSDVPVEKLPEEQQKEYYAKTKEYFEVWSQSWPVSTKALREHDSSLYCFDKYSSIEDYLIFLSDRIDEAIEFYQKIFQGVDIPACRFEPVSLDAFF